MWAIIVISLFYACRWVYRYYTGYYEPDRITVTNADGTTTNMRKSGPGIMGQAPYEKE